MGFLVAPGFISRINKEHSQETLYTNVEERWWAFSLIWDALYDDKQNPFIKVLSFFMVGPFNETTRSIYAECSCNIESILNLWTLKMPRGENDPYPRSMDGKRSTYPPSMDGKYYLPLIHGWEMGKTIIPHFLWFMDCKWLIHYPSLWTPISDSWTVNG